MNRNFNKQNCKECRQKDSHHYQKCKKCNSDNECKYWKDALREFKEKLNTELFENSSIKKI